MKQTLRLITLAIALSAAARVADAVVARKITEMKSDPRSMAPTLRRTSSPAISPRARRPSTANEERKQSSQIASGTVRKSAD